MLHAVIMAGGSGTRFWPESRRSVPKQFLPLAGEQTLLQQTSARCRPLIPAERQWVVTNALQADLAREQLSGVPGARVLVEPCARNTAPCIGLAAVHLLHADRDAVMAVLPSDHLIQPDAVFREALATAQSLVQDDPRRLLLFGVRPTYPATGFGYIERGAPIGNATAGAYAVATFREKPVLEVAEQYVASGRFYWNCGIFVWRADRILALLEKHEPDMHARLKSIAASLGTPQADGVIAAEFPQMRSVSIDYAVLEREPGSVVLEAPYTWDDLGSWQALARQHGIDEQGNTVIGLHRGVGTKNCIVRTSGDHLVATLGLEDCIVVHTPDATLVARRGDEEAIRKLIDALRERGDERFL
ncbi:MAG: mannose-1-phosphate guanylyltransferase [Planctomycetaceae bacterium]|nr:mannose-1-phosphate guanylyltransferase [Planctomycetaceae bacterium]